MIWDKMQVELIRVYISSINEYFSLVLLLKVELKFSKILWFQDFFTCSRIDIILDLKILWFSWILTLLTELESDSKVIHISEVRSVIWGIFTKNDVGVSPSFFLTKYGISSGRVITLLLVLESETLSRVKETPNLEWAEWKILIRLLLFHTKMFLLFDNILK